MAGGLPPLQWLVTFRSVMETGSFARAASQLNLTPSAISHQMRALETRLGKPLFLRRNRSVVPTEDAMLYSASIGESFARLVTATHRVAAQPGARRLPIHCSPSFAALWLVPRLASFQQAQPDIDITLFASHEPARLAEDDILIDIQYARPVPDHCVAIPLLTERVFPMATPAFIKAAGLATPADISRVPLIHSLRCVVSWEQWAARYAPAAPLHPRGHRFDRAHLALSAASHGLGMVLESNLQAHGHLGAGMLLLPFGDMGIPVVAHRLVYRLADRGHPDISAFVDWLTGELEEMDHDDGPHAVAPA
ncbi:MAG: LysR substrate-binding domain-containing protein [Beijerinckiaceae bacterium]